MANKTKATPQKEEAREEGPETPDAPLPLLDLSDAAVTKMIKQAKKRGYVTHQQLNAVIPSEEVTSEQIENILAALNDMGINVVETEEAEAEEEEPREEAESEETESGELVEVTPKTPAKSEAKEPIERTDDPVRMYLREMGSIGLLVAPDDDGLEGERALAPAAAIIASRPASIRLAARHHRSRSDLCRPRRQGGTCLRIPTKPRISSQLFAIPHGTRFGEKAAAGRITGTCLSPYRRHCRGPARPRERPRNSSMLTTSASLNTSPTRM